MHPEGDRLSVTLQTPARDGCCTCAARPAPTRRRRALGEDSFTYRVSDGNGGSDVSTVNVAVLQNRPPVARRRPGVCLDQGSVVFDPINERQRSRRRFGRISTTDTAAARARWSARTGCRTPRPTAPSARTPSPTPSVTVEAAMRQPRSLIEIAENGPPVAVDDKADTVDTRTASLSVLGNDRIPTRTSSASSAIPPARSARSLHRVRLLLHPECCYAGPFPVVDTFTYVMTDGKTGSDEDRSRSRSRRTARRSRTPDEIHAHGRVMQPVNPIANDVDPDQDPLTLVSVSSDHLGCALSGCVYTPPPRRAASIRSPRTWSTRSRMDMAIRRLGPSMSRSSRTPIRPRSTTPLRPGPGNSCSSASSATTGIGLTTR